ncbi:MAG: ROK family protein [Candidatus Levybacteria bacterium]|nr:ROK family protein [Candidatus Levybacteria bacterium]MBI3092744.1 ROK family protein [Candidatus Levybacteria bacterium]
MGKKIIGIDIGGTKIRGVLWNGKKVLKARETATPKSLIDFKSTLIKLINSLGRTDKIAIGVAGVVSGSKLVKSPNISYIKHFDFSNMNKLVFNNMILDNDARCFGRAEYKMRSAAGKITTFFITLGTGVGRAVGQNGKILKIRKFEYPERWESEYKKFRDSKDNKRLAEYLSEKLIKLIKPYQPQIIIVGGGVLARKGFFAKFKKTSRLALKKSRFGKNAVAVGAAELF